MRTAVFVILCAIFLIAVWGFLPEARAIAWHIGHGMHVDGAGMRVEVPLLYSVHAGELSVVEAGEMGRFRARFGNKLGGLIFISRKLDQGSHESADDWWQRTIAAESRQGAHEAGRRNIKVAGQDVRCIEFEGGVLQIGIDVWCTPSSGSLIMDYLGPRKAVNDFYAVLESAQARK